MAKIGRNDPCSCGSGKKFKKCCEERGRTLMSVADGGDLGPAMQLMIQTRNGLAVRNISAAMPLRLRDSRGKEAENATHDAAAIWGLADFVFEPAVRQRASGVRELGDGILVLGDLGVVLQVKSREAGTDSPDRERRWIEKQCKKALAQGSGTIRELRREPAPMTNLRGRRITLDGKDFKWLTAVIVDHDDPPEDVMVVPTDNAVILLRRDWDFLFEQLKSTHAVGSYLARVAGELNELGDEPVRYYQLANLDADAEPRQIRPELVIPGAKRLNEPMLPMAPAATHDREEHRVFRTILEDTSIRLSQMPEEIRLRALAELDSLPTQHRANAGRFLLDGLAEVGAMKSSGTFWRHRRFFGEGETQLAMGVCSRYDDQISDLFGTWVELRHHEFTERIGPNGAATIGVLLTPRADGKRRWDTTMCVANGRLEFDEEHLAVYEGVWNNGEQEAA